MAVNEISGFLKFKDTNGDTNLLLPITTKDNVDGLDEIENSVADLKTQLEKNYVLHQDILTEDNVLKQNVLPAGYPYIAYGNILPETTVTISEGMGFISGSYVFLVGHFYKITWDGTEYNSECVDIDGMGALGNVGLASGGESNGQPFIIGYVPQEEALVIMPVDGSTEVTLSIDGDVVQKIDKTFIPELDYVTNIVNGSSVGSIRSVGSKAEDGEYTMGDYSHAEGYHTTASGNYGSHAEGFYTTASGSYSHAEGYYTTASGNESHAEGSGTTASGDCSHTEGSGTTASGYCSHAEGCGTTVSSRFQHVQGKFNIDDSGNKYAHIVGNGDNQNARSNAHTLDWDGNGWFKGGLKVGGNSQDDKAAREVAFKDEVDLLKDAGVLLKDEVDLLKDEAVGKRVEGQIFTVDGESVTAKSGAEIFNNYSYNIATGQDSHAEGSNTTASGYYSHAEGSNTTASGYYSHAEGSNTTASGSRSHAEGAGTEASGEYSHAEGSNTNASGKASHAECYNTTASGEASHAEGFRTEATGNWSHAEGYRTKAYSDYQHVQGTYNVKDTANKYAHIVGNGIKDSDNILHFSNAHTLDWDGNGWFQGDVYVGSTSGTNRDEGSKKLATESYADIVATNAADAVKNDLLNGAGAAYDTLKELGELIDGNQDAIDALETVASSKADKDHSHDWETIENRPFGEVPGADTVYWDGNREGLVKADGYDRYMVSTATPTLADFENGASNTKLLSGTESTSNLGMGTAIYEAGDGCIVVGNTIVALKDGATLGDEVYPKKGTYFTWIGNDSYTTRLTINGYTGFLVTKKIDPQWLPNHFHNLGPAPVVTSGDGAAYTVTIDGVTELYNGLQFLMLPHTNSTTTAVTLNVNGLGAKTIRQRMGTNTSIGVAGATANWIVANKPITVTYNGSTWMVEIERPDAANIYGTVAVKSGGTGKASVTAGNFLVGNGTEAMVEKTPSEVLSLINGVSNDEFTNKVNELIDTKMASITNAEEVAF